MKLASIVPMKNVSRTFDGDYAMLLTHLANYYPKTHHKNCYVIMDNSLIELGSAASIEATYKAAVDCDADEIILPDVFRNYQETIKSVKQSLQWLHERDVRGFKYMAVCQGATVEDFRQCFRELEAMPEIHCIGIPKVCSELLPQGRVGFEDMWLYSKKVIHLLGCRNTLSELLNYKYPQLIRSCDTCVPALLSVHKNYNAWSNRPEKTIDLLDDKIDELVYDEILEQLREARLV